MNPKVTESDLHAYLDGQLAKERRDEVEAHLSLHPQDAQRLAAYRAQNDALRKIFDPVLEEAVPPQLYVPRIRRWAGGKRFAAIVAWMVLGGVIGWQLHALRDAGRKPAPQFAQRAAIAHALYSPEVRHPVEVGADQEAHLVAWLSKRLGTSIKVPYLAEQGYSLVGGRLLPGENGPVAQFMYQDGNGQRLTLYVRVNAGETRDTAFRFTQEKNIGVFYWIDQRLAYALSGEIEKPELLRLANSIYQQLNP